MHMFNMFEFRARPCFSQLRRQLIIVHNPFDLTKTPYRPMSNRAPRTDIATLPGRVLADLTPGATNPGTATTHCANGVPTSRTVGSTLHCRTKSPTRQLPVIVPNWPILKTLNTNNHGGADGGVTNLTQSKQTSYLARSNKIHLMRPHPNPKPPPPLTTR